ncbi:UDP-N-acetylmuramate dehydrogenase [Marinicellulosiphila megalodicopiae]|uniref:UDP-N-acetylmuramate dehydrogenase n=1 Tax=Marinicellulosiphila megalodicopiae TaxID=2724896 RepID=UPI003BAEAB06
MTDIHMPSFIQQNFDLQNLSTMACPSTATFFASITRLDQLTQAIQWARQEKLARFVIGEGSNLLLASQINGLVLNIKLKGIQVSKIDETHSLVVVQSGENWHKTVVELSKQHLHGLENLSFIPGSVGASPVQNIGAYGVEVSQLIEYVEYFDPSNSEIFKIQAADCEFRYRDSIFKKGTLKDVIIVSVAFKLSGEFKPDQSYAGLPKTIGSPQQWIEQIGEVRWSKLPKPEQTPNAGSFFKNPIISKNEFIQIQTKHPEIVFFYFEDQIKIPAGWLIDQLGFKGKINSAGVGCYHNQALVLINTQKKPRDNILEKALEIKQSVKAHFDIDLEIEPQLLG